MKTSPDFRLRAAADLYASKAHPRILFGPDDLARLQAACQSGVHQKILRHLRRKVKPLAQRVLEAEDLVDMLANWNRTWHEPGTTVIFGLFDMAMVAEVDDDASVREAVIRVLQTAPLAEAQSQKGRHRFGYACGNVMAICFDIMAPHMTKTDRQSFTEWAREYCVDAVIANLAPYYLKCSGGNIPLGGMVTGITTTMAIAGEPGAGHLSQVRQQLLQWLEATLHTAICEDGYPEEDTGYGTVVTGGLSVVVESLRRAGWYDVYAECPRYARFGNAVLHLVQPWGEALCNTGDHGDDFGAREFVLCRLAAETNNPALIWLLKTLSYNHGVVHPENDQPEFYGEVPMGKGQQVPNSGYTLLLADQLSTAQTPHTLKQATTFVDRTRGFVSFRSGWRPKDTLLTVDGSQRSPSAQGHAHASCGHFSMSALGEYFAIDTGRYNIEQSCHNVVLINGKSGRSTDGEWIAAKHHGLLTGYETSAFVDVAKVDSSLQHNCQWARRWVGLVKGSSSLPAYAWTVDDMNLKDDWAEYWWQLQTSPENRIAIRRQQATITGWRHGNHMDLHFAVPNPEEYARAHTLEIVQDEGVASSHKYVSDIHGRPARFPRPAAMVHGPVYVRPRLLAKVAGYNGRLMSVMVPRIHGDKRPNIQTIDTLSNALAIRIRFANVEDTIIFAYEHHLLEAAGISGRGDWCVVRRRRHDGRVLRCAMGGGDRLIVDGKRQKPLLGHCQH